MHSTFNIRRCIYASYSQKPLMSQILINVLEIFLAIGSHVCTCHTGYTGDGQTCLGDFNKFPSMFRKVLYNQRGAILLLLFLYIQSQLFEAGSNLKRPFNSNYGAGSNQIFILKCSSTEHSIVGCDVVRLIPIRHRRVFNTEYLRWARLLQ